MKQCAVSIDLDNIACYYRIHGLGEPPAELENAIFSRALPRATALFARHNLRVTWFVIGSDVANSPDNQLRLRDLAQEGDELANHSLTHPYDLAALPPSAIANEIAGCDRVLRTIAGPVRGFRAPGYDVSPAVFDVLAQLGYHYDSSVFPSPPYYVAKAAVMGAMAALRRTSGAVLTNPRLLAASPEPYRPAMAAPWRRGQAPFVELPIATTPRLRVHAIGTSLVIAPPWLRERIIDAMAKRSFWNLELHGIDFADADQDGLPNELVARQPDLRVPIDDKLERIDRVLEAVKQRWNTATLAEVAADVQREA